MIRPAWIAVDWGTSRLRIWAMTEGGEVLAQTESERGASGVAAAEFEGVLLELVDAWLDDSGSRWPVIACGMLGSRQGWIEAPYLAAPCLPIGEPVAAPVADPRIEVLICPGVKQDQPADVMRGEETQIAGLLSGDPDFDGFICLPGTHSKWVRVADGRILGFETFFTGELFDLLANQSILTHSLEPQGWDDEVFSAAVSAALAAPEKILSKLFSIRAESLLQNQDSVRARSRLSGLVVGAELAGARKYWREHPVTIVGGVKLAQKYAAALIGLGTDVVVSNGENLAVAGLQIAYRNWKTPR